MKREQKRKNVEQKSVVRDGKEELRKPRLLITTDNFLPRWDGIARFLSEVIPRLTNDFDVTLLSPDYGPSPLDKLVRRVRVPLRKKTYGDYTPAEWQPKIVKVAVRDADIVFNQTIGPVGWLAQRYARRYKKPRAAFIHSIEWELVPKALDAPFLKRLAYPLAKLATRFVYNRAGLLIVPSYNTAELLTWQHIKTRKRVVQLGVDTKKFVKGDKARARAKLDLPQEAFIVGFHGRLGYEKNLLTLARAYGQLRAKEKRLLLVGDGVESLRKRLSRMRGVLLPGAQDNVVPYLQAMDAYVMPSFTETTSLAVLEAMSCELPVISSPVGFIQQYIKDGKNGFFFDTKSWYDLHKKLSLVAGDERLRVHLGQAARATVKEKFDWDVTGARFDQILKDLLGERES